MKLLGKGSDSKKLPPPPPALDKSTSTGHSDKDYMPPGMAPPEAPRPAPQPAAQPVPRPAPQQAPQPPKHEAPRPRAVPIRSTMNDKSPPLFIKVEKYRDVVKNIRTLRSYILNLRDALDVLEDIHKELANGVHIAQKSLDELNMIISSLDSFFLRPQGVPHLDDHDDGLDDFEEEHTPHHPDSPRPKEVEHYVKDVYGQLEKLRTQLKTLS